MRLDERNNLLIESLTLNLPRSRVIVANITKHRFEIYTLWDLITQLSRVLVEPDQICQLLECAPQWEEQSINRVFDSSLPGSRVIVTDITKHRFEIYTLWDLITQLSRVLVEPDQICQLLECAPRWEEQSINRVFDSKLAWIASYSNWYNKTPFWDLYPLGPYNSIISSTSWARSNMSIARMCASMRGTIY